MTAHPTAPAPGYVRLTFVPAGAKRSRTTWAKFVRAAGKLDGRALAYYAQCKADGGDYSYARRDGVVVEETRLILTFVDDAKPARWNLHYGELEVVA